MLRFARLACGQTFAERILESMYRGRRRRQQRINRRAPGRGTGDVPIVADRAGELINEVALAMTLVGESQA